MLAQRRPLLLAFAGGCLSGVTIILSGVGVVSLWRSPVPALSTPPSTHLRGNDRALAQAADSEARGDGATEAARANAEQPSPPRESNAAEPPEHAEPQHASADHGSETGSSVADVLTRLEAAYRQGLIDGARAGTNQSASSDGAPPNHGDAAPEALAAAAPAPPVATAARDAVAHEGSTAGTNAPAVAAATPAAPAVVAVPQPVTVVLANPSPPAAAPVVAAGAAPAFVPPDQSGSHDAAASVTQNIHVDNLHQGDVYQQLQVMQYMQLLALSPYGSYPGYTPAPPVPAHHQHGAATTSPPTSPFSTPPLPNAAPPFPSFLTSLTNPANPWGTQHRGRALR